DRIALHVFDDLTSFDVVLATEGLGDARAQALERAGVKLRIVKTKAS
ncbi:DeoR/GlpR transcriptional regulator, partial [Mesorhizobium sp. M7A.F.Ca.CA.001.11.2.1]